jgi:hypothetical protein
MAIDDICEEATEKKGGTTAGNHQYCDQKPDLIEGAYRCPIYRIPCISFAQGSACSKKDYALMLKAKENPKA